MLYDSAIPMYGSVIFNPREEKYYEVYDIARASGMIDHSLSYSGEDEKNFLIEVATLDIARYLNVFYKIFVALNGSDIGMKDFYKLNEDNMFVDIYQLPDEVKMSAYEFLYGKDDE